MRGPKLVWFLTPSDVTETGKALSLQVIDVDTRAQVGVILIDGQTRAKFPDVAQLILIAAYVQAAWAVHVVPLGHVLTVRVEYLNAVVLAVRDVHVAILIRANAVNEVKFPWIAAGLAPGKDVFPIWRIFVHPGVAIPIGHVYVTGLRGQSHLRRTVEGKAALE